MGDITLNQVAADIGIIVAICGGFGVLYAKLKKFLEKVITEQLEPFSKTLRKIDKETCKNFIVRCIADVERGDSLSETEAQRFKEQYDHYINDLKENTYIKDKYEKLKAEGKL